MMTPPSFAEIEVEGPDAGTFLHGQLANDVRSIEVGQWRYGSYCVADGRVQALLMIARPAAEHWRMLLPADVATLVVGRLVRYRLRSRCVIVEKRVGLTLDAVAAATLARYQCSAFSLAVVPDSAVPMPAEFYRQQIELGIPWILAATSERYLPQMLGLQRLQAFSLRKGCFPGQEVVARTHFLGRVKRRLVRLSTVTAGAALQAGAELCLHPGGAVAATVLLGSADQIGQSLAVVGEDVVKGTVIELAGPGETATYVIDRDVIETLSDEVLNGRYHPPSSA